MAIDDNSSNHSELHHLRRDARDAHSDSQLAKWLSILALIVAGLAMALSMAAMDKAGQAQSTANRATEATVQTQ